MFKICVIGCGNMSESGHGPAFKKYKNDYNNVCLCACCDINEERAKNYMETFGFNSYYTDYKKMLEEMKPDVVSLISPVHLTCSMSIEIMKMGFNVIMEKPPGKNREEIELMIKQAEKSKVNVRTSFNRRYTPLILELKDRIAKTGEKIINITYHMYRYNRVDNDFSTTAIHAVDVVKNIAGADYKEVSISYNDRPELGENVKNIFLNAEFENGAYAQISFAPVAGAVIERLSVNTLNNTFFVDLPVWNNIDVPGKLVHIENNQKVETITGDMLSDSTQMYELTGFYDENRLFFEHLRNNDEIICDLESAIQSVEIEDCIRNSQTSYKKEV